MTAIAASCVQKQEAQQSQLVHEWEIGGDKRVVRLLQEGNSLICEVFNRASSERSKRTIKYEQTTALPTLSKYAIHIVKNMHPELGSNRSGPTCSTMLVNNTHKLVHTWYTGANGEVQVKLFERPGAPKTEKRLLIALDTSTNKQKVSVVICDEVGLDLANIQDHTPQISYDAEAAPCSIAFHTTPKHSTSALVSSSSSVVAITEAPPPPSPEPRYKWSFDGKELHLIENESGGLELWQINLADGSKISRSALLGKLATAGFVTSPSIIQILNGARLKVSPTGDLLIPPGPHIYTWVCGTKQIYLVPDAGRFLFKTADLDAKKTEIVELPATTTPLRYFPLWVDHHLTPTFLEVHYTSYSNGWKIELVQAGNEVFYLVTKGTVSNRIDPITFGPDWTARRCVSFCLAHDVEMPTDTTHKATPLDCIYIWKGPTVYSLLRRGDQLSIRIEHVEGDTVIFNRVPVPLDADATADKMVAFLLDHELSIDENGEMDFEPIETVHSWEPPICANRVQIYRRTFLRDGVENEELEYISLNLDTMKAARKNIFPAPLTIDQWLAENSATLPVVNPDATIRGLYNVCKEFPAVSGKKISLMSAHDLIWRVQDVSSETTQFIPVDFAKDFPEEAQISFLKNQMESEGVIGKYKFEDVTDEKNRNRLLGKRFDYQIIESSIKDYLLLKEPTETDHALSAWCGYTHKTWPHSQVTPTIFGITHYQGDKGFGIRLIRSSAGGLEWAIYSASDGTIKRFAFDFRDIMQNVPTNTRSWFAQCFTLDSFDAVHNRITTKREKFQSKLDPTKIIDNDVWAITHVNTDERRGHSEVAIEGVENGLPFLTYAGAGTGASLKGSGPLNAQGSVHISRGSKFAKEVKGQPETDWPQTDWRDWRPDYEDKGPTWLRERSAIQKTVDSIYKDLSDQVKGIPIPFDIRGGKTSLLSGIIDFAALTLSLGNYAGYMIKRDQERVSVNCIEWAQEKLSFAGIHPLPKFKKIYTSPKDYLDAKNWDQCRSLSVRTMTQPVKGMDNLSKSRIDTSRALIYIPLKYHGSTIFISCDLTQTIQDAMGSVDWSPIGLVGHFKEQDYADEYLSGKRAFDQVLFSILIRGNTQPTSVDVTNYIQKEYPKLQLERIRQEQRDDDDTPGRGESWGFR